MLISYTEDKCEHDGLFYDVGKIKISNNTCFCHKDGGITCDPDLGSMYKSKLKAQA